MMKEITIKGKLGRPKGPPHEKGQVVAIRLNQFYRQGISQISSGSFSSNIKHIYEEYLVWTRVKNDIKKKIEEKSLLFHQSFSLFLDGHQNQKPVEAEQAKEKVLRSAIELKFLSELLGDSHLLLQSILGTVHYRYLQEVWKMVKV